MQKHNEQLSYYRRIHTEWQIYAETQTVLELTLKLQ